MRLKNYGVIIKMEFFEREAEAMEKYINEYIRPRLQGDGGEITFVSENGGEVTVLLQGECSKCLILDRCLKWIEERIEADLNRKVKVIGIRKKPYFQDV